ncbi:MAG TPA: hypothetical protein VFW76_02925 [Ktedonobacterales bacterium]|nr:hypothetical protein [Ktedonobacterales bacterium]
MANTSGKSPMSDDERADLKAMIAAGRELSPEMDESLVESYAQRRTAEQQAKAKVQGNEVVAQQQGNNPLANINPAVAITGIVAMAAVFIVIMVASGGHAWWLIFPIFGIFGGWMGRNDRRLNARRAQRYQMRADYYRRRMGYADRDDARLPESAEREEEQLPPPPTATPPARQTALAPRPTPPSSGAPSSGVSDTQPPINPAG